MTTLYLFLFIGFATVFTEARHAKQYVDKVRVTTSTFCVYNSECEPCQPGQVRWCRANNCMCEMANGPFNGDLVPGRAYPVGPWTHFQCHSKAKHLPLAAYFDTNRGMCIEQYEIASPYIPKSACKGHEILFSRVDSKYYCADQISVFDFPCNENLDCHHLFSDSFVTWCQTGMCHAIHTVDRNLTINELPQCYKNFIAYCREPQHIPVAITRYRVDACQAHCKKHYDVSGIPSTSSMNCLCFAFKERPSNHIRIDEKNFDNFSRDLYRKKNWQTFVPKMFITSEEKDDLIAS